MTGDSQADLSKQTETIEIDERVTDATDLSMLAYGDVGDAAVELVGEPSDAGQLPESVRVTGTLEVVREDE